MPTLKPTLKPTLNLNKHASVWIDLRYLNPELSIEVCISRARDGDYHATAYTREGAYVAKEKTRLKALLSILLEVCAEHEPEQRR